MIDEEDALPPYYDMDDPTQVEVANEAAGMRRDYHREALRQVLLTEYGRAVIWALLQETGVYAPSYTGEAHSTFYREGRRAVGLMFLEWLMDTAPEAYDKLRREAIEREHRFKKEVEGG